MRRDSAVSLIAVMCILVVVSGSIPVALAAEFIQPRTAQPSLLAQFTDFLVRQRTGLSALLVLSGIAGSWRAIQSAMHELRHVPMVDWVWRWGTKLVVVAVSLLGGLYWFHTDSAATVALELPKSACNRLQKEKNVAVVLLHGWVGDADTTWSNFPKLICEDESLSDIDLFVVDYPTFLARRQLSIAELGRWLRNSFFSDSLQEYSQIHIIAHSMGGPMAREMYLEDVIAGSSKIRSIITIASPFLGAQPAEIARVLGVSEDLMIDLRPESGFLKALANNWEASQRRPATYCFASPQDLIVSMGSAKYQCDCTHDYPQWGHIDMVKPIIAADERYRMPIRALKNARAIAQAEAASRPRCFSVADSGSSTFKSALALSRGEGRLLAQTQHGGRM